MKFIPCIATYQTLWKTPTTLCKSPWRVYELLIIFSASGFPVIIKFQPAACNLQNIPAEPEPHVRGPLTSSFRGPLPQARVKTLWMMLGLHIVQASTERTES